jgi:type I restriction enzyme S subunit
MSEWREVEISYVCKNVLTGGTPSTKVKEYYDNADIPWLKTKEVNFSKIIKTEYHISKMGLENSSAKLIPKNSVIVAMYGQGDTAGRVAINKIPLTTNQACCNLVIDTEKSTYLFIYYCLKNSYEELVQIKTGSAQPNLNTKLIKSYEISLPPLPEQKAIAEVLSSVDDKIDLLHRQNKTLEQMAQTLFRQWFVEEAGEDWEEIELKKLCKVITKGTTPTSLKRSFVASGINFIKVNCIDDNGGFLLDKFNYIDEETHYSFLKRSILEEDDILYSIAGTIGRSINVTKDILPANVNQALAIIRVDKKIINPLFVKLSLNDKNVTHNLHSKIVHAVQPNLSLGEIGGTILPLPSKEALENFDHVINPIDLKIKKNKTKIRTLQSLRDTLLPKLMSGEIRVAI